MTTGLALATQGLALLREASGARMTSRARRASALISVATTGPSRAPAGRRQRATARWRQHEPQASDRQRHGPAGVANGPLMRSAARAADLLPRGAASGNRLILDSARPRSEGTKPVAPAGRAVSLATPSKAWTMTMARARRALDPAGFQPWRSPAVALAEDSPSSRLAATLVPALAGSARDGAPPATGSGRRFRPLSPSAGASRPFAPPAARALMGSVGSLDGQDVPNAGPTSHRRPGGAALDPATVLGGTLHLDGNALGQWVTRHLERTLTSPQRGPSGIDPRAVPVWGSASAGF